MPVQSNIGIQTVGTLGWDGATSYPMNIRNYVRFGWNFEILEELAEDTVFRVEAAAASPTDDCVPLDFNPVPYMPICSDRVIPQEEALITIDAGLKPCIVGSATIPCRPNVFVRVVGVSGDIDKVRVINLRQGPRY